MKILTKTAMLAAILLCVVVDTSPAADELTAKFGFSGLEIYKVSNRSGNLLSGDFNHDGKQDILVVDNSKSRIDPFQQRNGESEKKEESTTSVNEISNDRRYEHRKLPVDDHVSSLTVGDFNHDGRTDIAYIGMPDKLVVLIQNEEAGFDEQPEQRIPDVSQSTWAIDGGDLNQDGKDDLVLIGNKETSVLIQGDSGFERPVKLLNTSERLSIARIVDLDGDKRNDLCYLASSGQNTLFCARLQDEHGRLGAELQFDVKRQRSLTTEEVDGEPGEEILTIDPLTNRVKMLKLQRPQQKAGELAGKLLLYGFGGSEGARDRDLA
ncbi:MAG: VCBS repeat-containing protein, partial [Planctomycetes bacterium]|nr:VCBS repeat-containing protein [Planctomycetota bacterium]